MKRVVSLTVLILFLVITQTSAFPEVLNNTGFEWGVLGNETYIAWNRMTGGTGLGEVTSTDKFSGQYSALLYADDDVEGGGYGIVEISQQIKGYETETNVTNVSFLYKIVESTGDSYAFFFVDDTYPPTGGIREYFTDCNWTRVVYDVSAYDPEIGPWRVYFGVNSGDEGGAITALFDDITTDGSTPYPDGSVPQPPPPPGTGYIHWTKAVEDTGINQDYVQWLVHGTELWLIDCYNGVIYNSTDGFNYNVLNSDPDPWNATINPSYSGRLYPGIIDFDGDAWVIGGRWGASPINDSWYSSDGLTWTKVTGDPWNGALASRIGFGLAEFNSSMFAIGGEVGPTLADISGTHNTADGLTNPWTLLGTGYIGGRTTALSRSDAIYTLTEGAYIYKTTDGVTYTYVSDPSLTAGTRGYYYGSYLPQNQFFLDYNNALWLLGAGYGNGYYSSNNGSTWSLDRAYTEYPNIAQSSSFIAYDGSLLPEVLFSYDPVGDDIWWGGYPSQADFSGTPTSGQYNLSVSFTDLSTNSPTSWFWQFGDGENSTSQNPTHIYTYPGVFDVALTSGNSYGNTTTVKADYISVADQLGVGFWGHVYDALTNGTVSGANVSFLQLGTYHNTTSNATGGYAFGTEFQKLFGINASASKTGYLPFPTYFWVNTNGTYEYDLWLIPEFNVSPTDAWVGGFVYDEFWATGIPGATVTIWNDTWSDTNTTLGSGFYLFTNLTNTSYSVNATALTFDNSLTYSVLPEYGCFTQQDIPLSPNYQIDLDFKDADTLATIYSNITVILMNTNTSAFVQQGYTTTGAWSSGLIDYGDYNVTVSCVNYSTERADISLYSNVSGTIYLTADENFDGANTNYVPRPVRFTYVDAYGNPITGATVTATALESTNPWSWLEGIFGFSSTVDIQGTVLSGTTGSDGTLSFMMIETVEYRVNCVKASAGIDHTVDIYPKNTEYFIRIGSLPMVGSYPTYSLNATTSGGNVILFGNYTDTSGSSSGVRFIVRNSTGSEVYNTSVTLTGGVGSAYYSVNNTKGTQLTFGITSEHTTQGHIEKWIDITLKGSTGRLVDFGSGWTDFMYLAMSIAAIFLVGGCFGEIDTRLGAIFIPITAGMFWTIGWMGEVYGPLITIAGVLGALYYMRSKAKELDT